MPLVVVCSQCGHRAGAKEEWAGKRLKCPACGNLVIVPAPAQATPRAGAPASGSTPRAVAPAPQQTRPPVSTDLFGVDLGAAADPFASAAAAPLGPTAGPALGSPAARPRKASNSTKTLVIVLAVVGGVMLLGCAGLVALLLPAIQQARERARATIARGGMPQVPPPVPMNLPAWSADPARAAQLGDEVTFDRYTMKLPKNFASTPFPDTPGVATVGRIQKWIWAGPPSPRGDRQAVLAILVDAQGQNASGTLDQALAGFVQGVQNSGPTKIGAQQKGMLLGKPFVRVQYTMSPPNGITVHTIAYLGLDGNRLIIVQSVCADAEGSDVHRLLEAALLTLREK